MEELLPKIILLILVISILSCLITFSIYQKNIFEESKKVYQVQTIARLIDSVHEGICIKYNINYEMEINGNSVSADGVKRYFISNVSDCLLQPGQIKIEKNNGVVHVWN